MNSEIKVFENTAEYLLALSQRKQFMALGTDISAEQRHDFDVLNRSIKFHEAAVELIVAGVIRR